MKQKQFLLPGLLLALGIIFLCSLLWGSVSLTLKELASAIADPDSKEGMILFGLRLPRSIAGILAGMGLAASGSVIQTVFQNSLASPNIIGVNAGSSFFVILAGAFLPARYLALPIAAFAGAFFAAGAIFLLGKWAGFSKTSLVLSGMAMNSLFSSATDLLCTLDDRFVMNSKVFRMGSLNGVNTDVMLVGGICIFLALAAVMLLSNELEVLSFGEETAISLGLPVAKYRVIFLSLAAVLAGSVICFAGPIGFVGLMVPHLVKLLRIRETRTQILVSALLGAVLVSVCDLLARLVLRPHEIPVGILLSFLGVPFFLWLLTSRKRGINHA